MHGWTGIGGSTIGNPHQKMRMGVCELVQIDHPTRELVALIRVALGISRHLDENDPAKHHLLTALDEAGLVLDLRIPIGEGFYQSVSDAYETFRGVISIWAAAECGHHGYRSCPYRRGLVVDPGPDPRKLGALSIMCSA